MSSSDLKELERQRAEITERISEIETARDSEKSAQFVGRYFKYRNNYSCPETAADYWWMYFKVTDFDGRRLKGYSFERDKYGEFRFNPNAEAFHHLADYEEIDGKAFVRARAKFIAELAIAAEQA